MYTNKLFDFGELLTKIKRKDKNIFCTENPFRVLVYVQIVIHVCIIETLLQRRKLHIRNTKYNT